MTPGGPEAKANTQYELYGVLVHLDMFNISAFGHYISYVKTNGKW